MCLLKKVIFYMFLTTAVNGDNANIKCPRFCKCDSYQQLNRAQCSSKNLISAELDLPNQVQILDLSYNDITTIDNKCFLNFFHLKYLNLSHNALHTLEWEAFAKLRRLTELNLSYNRLEYLDERFVVRNKYLNKINLEGNKLQTLDNKPLIRNPFVSDLILKNSQINLLQPQTFSGLGNLKRLDLSQNFLNNFNAEDFQHLPKLVELNLNENFIKCDGVIRNKLKQLEERGINVILDECKSEVYAETQRNQKMFEKLMLTEAAEDRNLSTKINQWRLNLNFEDEFVEDDNEEFEFADQKIPANSRTSNTWLLLAPDNVLCDQINSVVCQDYRTCLQDLNAAWHEKQQCKEQCSLNDIKFAFVMGIAIGVSSIVLILACALCLKRCFEAKKTAPTVNDYGEGFLTQPLARPTSQLPPPVRRQPRRRPARSARSVVRYEGPVGENFLSRLFGRPTRQQYYRTINQNTATLIRRLSRSNLFNNRLSQHFVERQISAEINSSNSSGIQASATRPETPPPSYGDVFVKNISVES